MLVFGGENGNEPKQTCSLPSQTVQFPGELGINHMTYTCHKSYEGKVQEAVRAREKEVTT